MRGKIATAVLALTTLAATGASYYFAPAVNRTFPYPCASLPSTETRIGKAQIQTYGIPQDQRGILAGVDVIWADNGTGSDVKVPGTHTFTYAMGDREYDYTARPTNWYRANHPDWIAYRCDQTSVAYEFNDTNYTPMNIQNPGVQDRIYQEVKARAQVQNADGIAIDNISPSGGNVCGYNDRGFHRLYNGSVYGDPAIADGYRAWMQVLKNKSSVDGLCLAVNHYWDENNTTSYPNPLGYEKMAVPIDVILDEEGYLRNNAIAPFLTDEKLVKKLTTFSRLAQTKGLILVDQISPDVVSVRNSAKQTALAIFLLIKAGQSYLTWPVPYDAAYHGNQFSEHDTPIGMAHEAMRRDPRSGFFYRHFEKQIAVLNPSSTLSAKMQVGSKDLTDLHGASYPGGIVELAPLTGMVLR